MSLAAWKAISSTHVPCHVLHGVLIEFHRRLLVHFSPAYSFSRHQYSRRGCLRWVTTPRSTRACVLSRPESQETFPTARQPGSRRHQQLVRKSKSPPTVPLRRCDQCSYVSDRTANVKRHKEKLHDQLQEVEHCCNREFRTRHDFIRHSEEAHSYGNYACSLNGCAKTFAKRSLLDRHIKAHKKEYKHVCKPCDYKTVVYSNYQRHRISGRCRARRGITLRAIAGQNREREAVQEQPQSKREGNRHSKREHDAALALLLLLDSLYERASEAVAELIDLHNRCLTECAAS
ncbi:hypothetical protein MTO96_028416 [Rhipicephalus appendiculatus]